MHWLVLRLGLWHVRPTVCKSAPPEAFEAERVVCLKVLLEQVVHAGLLALSTEPHFTCQDVPKHKGPR